MEEKDDPFYCGEVEETTPNRRPKVILRSMNTITEKTEEMKLCEKHGHDWQLKIYQTQFVELERVIVGGACDRCGVYFKEIMRLTPPRRTD